MSIRPVAEATEWSVTSAPVNRSNTWSLMPTQWATRACSIGSCSAYQRIFDRGAIGCTGVPVRRCRASPHGAARSRSAWLLARESAQVTDGVSGVPSGSRPIRLCIAVLNDRPAMPSPSSVTTRRMVSTTASTMSCGSCSAQPGCGSSRG